MVLEREEKWEKEEEIDKRIVFHKKLIDYRLIAFFSDIFNQRVSFEVFPKTIRRARNWSREP